MDKHNYGTQFVICPVCNGSGEKKGSGCLACGGLGAGTFFKNKFLYWGFKIGRGLVGLRQARKSWGLFLNLAAFFFGISGLLALAYWIFSNNLHNSGNIELFSFLRHKHWLIFYFWSSLLADMFIVYRLAEESETKNRIKKIKIDNYGMVLPNNWDELRNFEDKYNAFIGYGEEVISVLENAFLLADKSGYSEINTFHILLSLLHDRKVASLFIRLNVDGKTLVEKITNNMPSKENAGNSGLVFSLSAKESLMEAYIISYEQELKSVDSLSLLLACMQRDDNITEILYDLEVDRDKVVNVIQWFRINDLLLDDYKKYRRLAKYKPGGNMDRAYTAVSTPVLDHFSYDLTAAAKFGRLGFCVSREKEIKSIIQVFEGGKNGAILVGDVGVGRSSIIYGIAKLMVEEKVPVFLRDKRLIELDIPRLVSGANTSQAEERLLVVLDESARAGNVVLFIKNIDNLVGAGSGMDLSEVLAEALDRRRVYCLATCSSDNYVKKVEPSPLINMSRVGVLEPEGNQAIQIVESKIGSIEAKYGVFISYNSIEQAVKLSDKFVYEKRLPAKAIEVLEMTSARISSQMAAGKRGGFCLKEDIAQTITEMTGIPASKVAESEGQKLLNLEKLIHERMINQKEAVKMVADSLRRARAELREGKRPIASFLFLGPTGVGKTELAKAVAEVYFGGEDAMVRLDMSEYQHPDSIKKMIGDPDGTKGYLTEAVRKKPFALVLLDELEKANSEILNLFLQVMDDGRLTDGQGRTINFTNCILVATSNAGALYIQDVLKDNHLAREEGIVPDMAKVKEVLVNEYLNQVMRPELINRFDGLIVFTPLTVDNMVDITKLMLNKTKKILEIKGIGMRWEDESVKVLAMEGYDPKFGARPLRRLLQDKIDNEIAKKVLAGELGRRDTVVIDKNANVFIDKARTL